MGSSFSAMDSNSRAYPRVCVMMKREGAFNDSTSHHVMKKVLLQKVFCSSIRSLAKGHVFKRKHALCARMVSFIAPPICFSLLTPIPCLSLHLCTLVTRDCTPCCFRLSRPQRPSIQPVHIAKDDNELNAPDLSIIHGSLWLPVHKVGFCAP